MQKHFDHLIDGSTDVVAIRALEELVSVDGVVFPPTYAAPEKEQKSIYQTNVVGGKLLVVIDSVGSAANRAEDLFLTDAFRSLIPDVTLAIQDSQGESIETIRAFKCTHHIADSLLINSDHRERIVAALEEALNGNFELIAKIDPLSCLQGYWASRTDPRIRLPRIFSRRIDAYDIDPIRRSAQYEPSFKQDVLIATGVYALAKDFGEKPSELGFDSAPSVEQLGGVRVREGGSIASTTILNLIALQLLKATSSERTTLLRRYILALGLIQFVNPSSGYLRQGCLLVRKEGTTPKIQLFYRSGQVESIDITPGSALAYAQAVADEFGVGEGFGAVVNSQTASKGWKEQKAVGELKHSLKSPPQVDTAIGEGKDPKLPKSPKKRGKHVHTKRIYGNLIKKSILLKQHYHGEMYPPAPATIFQVLVAGGYADNKEATQAVLREMGTWGPPTVLCPSVSLPSRITAHSRDNVEAHKETVLYGQRKGRNPNQAIGRCRVFQAESQVHYFWNLPIEEVLLRQLQFIGTLLHRVGRGDDDAFARVSEVDQLKVPLSWTKYEAMDGDTNQRASDLMLTVPAPGSLQLIEWKYETQTPLKAGTLCPSQCYRRAQDTVKAYAAFLLRDSASDRPLQCRFENLTHVTAWFRHAANVRMKGNLHGDGFNGYLGGHHSNKELENQRLAFLPLPSLAPFGNGGIDGSCWLSREFEIKSTRVFFPR